MEEGVPIPSSPLQTKNMSLSFGVFVSPLPLPQMMLMVVDYYDLKDGGESAACTWPVRFLDFWAGLLYQW